MTTPETTPPPRWQTIASDEVGVPTTTGSIALRIAAHTLNIEVTVPSGPTALTEILPIFHGVANAVVEIAEARVARAGETISCRAGCGACCRQSVPVSPSEARALARLVDAMPEPRQGAIRARFSAGQARLAAAGVDTDSAKLEPLDRDAIRAFALQYMRVGVACPFLEAESCSIHLERPTVCREYLVTSPAVYCATPTAETIRMVPMSGRTSLAVLAVDRDLEKRGSLLLIDALDWAAANPVPESALKPGPGLVQAAFGVLAEQKPDA